MLMASLIPCTVDSRRVQTYPSSDAGSRHAGTVLFTTNGSSLVSRSAGQFNWAARLGQPTGLINWAMRVINWGSAGSNMMTIYVLCSSVDNCLMARNFSVGDTIHVRYTSGAHRPGFACTRLARRSSLSPQVPDRNPSTGRYADKRDAVYPQPMQRQPPAAAFSAAFAALDPDAATAAEWTKAPAKPADPADVAAV